MTYRSCTGVMGTFQIIDSKERVQRCGKVVTTATLRKLGGNMELEILAEGRLAEVLRQLHLVEQASE